MNRRLKAYTLTEMIVVMLLTAVVIGMAYSVFQIISKSYTSFNRKNEKVNDAERLEHWLGRDLQRADACLNEKDGLKLLIGLDTVGYTFKDSVVTRTSLRIDSFRVYTANLTLTFGGQMLDPKTEQPVDQVSFELNLEKQRIPEVFYKLYSAEQLIHITHAINRYQ